MNTPTDHKPASPPDLITRTTVPLVTVMVVNALSGAHHQDTGHMLPPEDHIEQRAVTGGDRVKTEIAAIGTAGTRPLPVGDQELSEDVMRQLWMRRAKDKNVYDLFAYRYPFLDD